MSNRHRRTRIYGANYDIGESYYKKQLNDLDSKKQISGSNDLSFEMDTKKESKVSPKVTFFSEDLDFNDKNTNILRKFNLNNNDSEDDIIQERSTFKPEELDIYSKQRKTNAHDFKDESFIKQRHFSKVAPNDYDLDEEFVKGSSKATREFSIDLDRHHKNFGSNLNRFLSKDNVGKQKSPVNLEEKATPLATFRSKFISDKSMRKGNIIEEEDALRRANVSKARLLDLEEEIISISNKQNEREKRNKNLKKILSEVSNQ